MDHITATANFTCQGGLAHQIFMKYSGKCCLSHDRTHLIFKLVTEWIHYWVFFSTFAEWLLPWLKRATLVNKLDSRSLACLDNGAHKIVKKKKKGNLIVSLNFCCLAWVNIPTPPVPLPRMNEFFMNAKHIYVLAVAEEKSRDGSVTWLLFVVYSVTSCQLLIGWHQETTPSQQKKKARVDAARCF